MRRRLPRIVEDAFDEVDRIDRLMSHYKADSPLSRINREAARHPVTVEPELFDFLAESMRYNRESDGAFDITVGPLMKAWGFFGGEGRMPSERRARRGPAPRRARARRPGSGGEDDPRSTSRASSSTSAASPRATPSIASVALLEARQVAAALVSAGGSTIYGLGAPPGRDGLGRDDPGSDRLAENGAHRHAEGSGPLRRRPLGEIVRVRTACGIRTSWTRAPGGRCRAC